MPYKNRLSKTLIPCFAVLALTACESMHYSNITKSHDMFSTDAGVAQRQVEGNVTAMPNKTQSFASSGESENKSGPSVEIYDMELNPAYQRGVNRGSPMRASMGGTSLIDGQTIDSSVEIMPNIGMPYQSNGRPSSSDSSVTIFDLDGGMPMNMAQQYGGQNNYGQNSYGAAGNVAGQIFFKHGSSRLGRGDMRKISNLADQAKFAPVNYITVEGFSSRPTAAGSNSTQAHIINLRQSMKRSEKVSMALVKKGVPGEKIKTVSWGATKATGNERQDRRVDVVMGEK